MTRTIRFAFGKILILFAALLMICNCAFASENLITSVTISKPKELNGAYQLTIKADKPVEYKVKTESSDSVYFDLKNSIAMDSLETIYDNVSGIDALIVQQLEKDKVRIYVNGINTAKTQLKFQTVQATGTSATNTVVINRPIREYRPTTDMEEIANEDIDWEDNSFNAAHFLASFGGLFGQKSDMTFVICLALLILTVVASRKIFAKIRISEEPLIGLSSASLKDALDSDENEFEKVAFKPASQEKPVVSQSTLDKRAKLNEVLKYASNSYERRKYAAAANVNAQRKNLIKENYALGAYEKSQRNPYATKVQQNTQTTYQRRAVTSPVAPQRVRPSQALNKQVESVAKKAPSVDNIKFLESVTKIYEQNGRGDLAQGLRTSIANKN